MKLLLIEDNTALCESLSFLLNHKGFHIDACHQGSEGLKWILRYEYDIIIIDDSLPQINGLKLLKLIRKKGLSIPVLMLTNNDNTEIILKKTNPHITKYLMKPFDFDILYEYINELLYPPIQPKDEVLLEDHLTFFDITFYPTKRLLIGKNKKCTLSKREAKILELFLNSSTKVTDTRCLWNEAWINDGNVDNHKIEHYINLLKRRLRIVNSSLDLIRTNNTEYLLGKHID